MPPLPPPSSALVNYLKRENPSLYGKVAEVRQEVTRLLTYVPATFGHYTSHTIDHSDEIVSQISSVLFVKKKPSVPLSATEAYILIVSAYLHDAGMVASEAEKSTILGSEPWRQWTTDKGGAQRWQEIQALLKAADDDPIKHFAANRAMRILIAEFIRREHHQRAGDLVRSRAVELGRIDVGDHMLRNAIADVCIAHGLDLRDLEDDVRFPEARDVQGERVNLRRLATLLRLGDLLDLRTDRACPLLLQAACPLPANSSAHWSQYQAIQHRLTTPEKLEIRAECRDQDEHRVLHDWCSWLVKEIGSLPARLPRTKWIPPRAAMDGPQQTIVIKPSPSAKYIPGDWKFELDEDAVFQRLISDVYSSPNVFIRELIQNALDATRCKMYADLKAAGVDTPEYPYEVAEEVRHRYPVEVSLAEERVVNPDSGETEVVQVVTVSDHGLGMNVDVVQRYLLQIGRSYYTTAEFRRSFPFHPSSRFGVGFLSVFGVSDDVRVDTYRAGSSDGPIRLQLTGPRSYILIEKSERTSPGTRVEVRLRKNLSLSLFTLVMQWCTFVEFPIVIQEPGGEESLLLDGQEMELEGEWVPHDKPSVRFVRRVYPVACRGIRGSIIILSVIEDGKERWQRPGDLDFMFPGLRLQGLAPLVDALAFHGVSTDTRTAGGHSRVALRLDVRRPAQIELSREYLMTQIRDEEVNAQLEHLVSQHLPSDDEPWNVESWRYRTELATDVHLSRFALWQARRDMIPVWYNGSIMTDSLKFFLLRHQWYRAANQRFSSPVADDAAISSALPANATLLSSLFPGALEGGHDAMSDSLSIWHIIMDSFRPIKLLRMMNTILCVFEQKSSRLDNATEHLLYAGRKISVVDAPGLEVDITVCGGPNSGWVILNGSRAFGAWYQKILAYSLNNGWISNHLRMIDNAFWNYAVLGDIGKVAPVVEAWNKMYAQLPELICPDTSPLIASSLDTSS